ncbi:thiol protease/hemagglutinin PrtT [Prevotella ihumii]|uniref:thiol protease/hemagglutinin PrtT n=1 Tax=Prevotella ihumii TaxID=1917878 RepID=UPI000980F64A|nr:thiol protease/hemagglutinin PrtT [Prevotella ihumii]
MKKSVSLLLLCAMMSGHIYADKVSKSQAQQIAQQFLATKAHRGIKAHFAAMPKKFMAQNTTPDFAPFYVYNAENNGGFVIVSGDDAVGQVLGYSDKGSFSLEGAPANVVAMFKMFARAVENAAKKAPTGPKEDAYPTQGKVVVAPLLGNIQWGQDAPFNTQFPTYTMVEKDHTGKTQTITRNYYVGCVATAMAQIMRFHQYPEQGKGTLTYKPKMSRDGKDIGLGNPITVDFSASHYDWSKMPQYMEQNNADKEQNKQVATLSQNVATSVYMSFDNKGSGTLSQFVRKALIEYFGYDKGINYIARDYYTTPEWMKLIKAELDAHRPVFYSASNEDGLGGHAFVCDGYDDKDYVHINWGWYGRSNGYFNVSALNPQDLGIGANGGGYNLQQEIITGIQRPTATSPKYVYPLYCMTRSVANYFDYKKIVDCMTTLKYNEAYDFNGELASVLVDKNNNIVDILKKQPLKLKGVDQNMKIDMPLVFVKGAPSDVPHAADGSDYKVMFAAKATGDTEWQIVRTSKNLPNYGEATVVNHKITKIKQHQPTPDVTLLSKITTDGPLYAKGSGLFKIHIKNNSQDYYVQHVWLKFTSVDDPSKVYYVHEDDFKTNQVYDNSEKEFFILCDLPAEMPQGKYKVKAYDRDVTRNSKTKEYKTDNFLAQPFNDEKVGETVLEVLGEATSPIIRQLGNFAYLEITGKKEVKQGEMIVISQPIRNYGLAGTTGLLLKAENVETKEIINFIQMDRQFKMKEFITNFYNVRVNLAPGKYRLLPYYINNNTEVAMENLGEECIVEIKENTDIPLVCEELSVTNPVMKPGVRYKGTKLTLKAVKDVKNIKLGLRLVPATRKNGEFVKMWFGKTLTAGQRLTETFAIKPKETTAPGKYLLYVEYADGKNYKAVAGKGIIEVTLGEPTGIEEVNTTANAATFSLDGKTLHFDNLNDIRHIDIYTLAGAKVYGTKPMATNLVLNLNDGIYVVRLTTAEGTVSKKVVLK